jgi:alpha-beta hydrolase superfamily lysophospholipase/thioredoxin-like negative regulator of GroEL
MAMARTRIHISSIKLDCLVGYVLVLSALVLQQANFPAFVWAVETRPAYRPSEKDEGETEVVETKGCIPCTSWVAPELVPWAAVLCIHGFTMDKNAYSNFGRRLSAVGIPTYAIDVRGFGSWQKAAGQNKLNFAQAMDDIHEAIKAVHKAHPLVPLILVGESMGGALALQAAAEDQALLSGLVCSVPAKERHGARKENRKIAISAALKGFNRPTDVGRSIVKQITTDDDLRAELESDPEARMDYSPKEMLQFQRFMNKTDKRAPEINKIPVLFLQGGSDHLVKVSGTAKSFEKIASTDKNFVLVGESEHLVLEAGQCADHTIDVVTSWIYEHARKKSQQLAAKQNAPDANTKAAQGHLKIAQGLIDLNDPESARPHLMQTIELGRGTALAMIASQLKAGLPKTPAEAAYEQQKATSNAGFVSHAEAMANDKPTVIFFGARWIEPSFELNDAMKRALKIYGDHVNFVRLDADLPGNEALVKAYDVTLIPTVLILNWKNDVVSTKYGPLNDRVLAALIDRGLFDSRFANKTEAPVLPPNEPGKAKPSVVFYGSTKQSHSQKVWNILDKLSKQYSEQFDLIKIDSDDPKNAARIPESETTSLPAVLFLNSANDQVAFSTGEVDEEQLAAKLSELLSSKHLPGAP